MRPVPTSRMQTESEGGIPIDVQQSPEPSSQASSSRITPTTAQITSEDELRIYRSVFGKLPKNLSTLDDIGQRSGDKVDEFFMAYAQALGLDESLEDEDDEDEDPGPESEDSSSDAGDKDRSQQNRVGDAEEKSSGDSESTDDEDVRFAVRASASKNSHPMRVHSEDEEDDGLSPNAPDAAPQKGKRVRWTSSTRPRSPAASQSEVPPSPSLSSSSSQSPPPSTPTPHDVDPVHGGSNQEATPVSPQAKRKGPPRAVPRTIYTTKFDPINGLPKEQVQLPSGLSKAAEQIRYPGMTKEQINLQKTSHRPAWEAVPPAARRAFGWTKASKLDEGVWIWAGPRIYHYSGLPKGQEREEYCALILKDLFEEFKDLHPDNFNFKDKAAELAYQKKLREFIFRRSFAMHFHLKKAGLLVLNQVPTDAAWRLVRSLLFGGKQRVHDLWAKQSDRAEELRREYPDYLKSVGASTTDMATLQTFRKGKLMAEPEAEQLEWAERTLEHNRNPDIPEPRKLAELLLPAIKSMIEFYSKHTGNPVLFGTGAKSLTNPDTVDAMMVYLGGRASSKVKNFLHSDGGHGRFLKPAWRQQLAEVFEVHFEGVSGKLDEILQEFGLSSASQPLPPPPVSIPYLEPPSDVNLPAPADFNKNIELSSKQVNSLETSLHTWFKNAWYAATSSKRINYAKIRRAQETGKHFSPACRPVVGGKVVEFEDPHGMEAWKLVAWANHLSNKSLRREQRFAFTGENARSALRGEDMPSSIHLAKPGNTDRDHGTETLLDMEMDVASTTSADGLDYPQEPGSGPGRITASDSDVQGTPESGQDRPLPAHEPTSSLNISASDRHSGHMNSDLNQPSEGAFSPDPNEMSTAAARASVSVKGKGKAVQSRAEFAFAPRAPRDPQQLGENTTLSYLTPLPISPATYGKVPIVPPPPNFWDLGRRLFTLASIFPQAPILELHHNEWKQEETWYPRLNDLLNPIPLAMEIPRDTMTSKGFLDDLVARIRGFVHQLRDSLKTPGERRPSFHLAISTAARYIICGAAVSKTWQSWPTPGAGPVEFRLLRDTLTELAAELAQIAFIGAALFYYENCGLQVSPSALPPQDCLPREAVELIAAWAASLRQYRIPTEDMATKIWGRAPAPEDGCPEFLDPERPATISYKSSLETPVKDIISPSGRQLWDMPLAEQSRAVASIVVCLKHRIASGDNSEEMQGWTSNLRQLISRLRHLSSTPESRLPLNPRHLAISQQSRIPQDITASTIPSHSQQPVSSSSEAAPTVRPKPQLKRKDKSSPTEDWQVQDLARININGRNSLVRFVQEPGRGAVMRYVGGEGGGEVVLNPDGSPAEPIPFCKDWLVNPVRSGFAFIRRRIPLDRSLGAPSEVHDDVVASSSTPLQGRSFAERTTTADPSKKRKRSLTGNAPLTKRTRMTTPDSTTPPIGPSAITEIQSTAGNSGVGTFNAAADQGDAMEGVEVPARPRSRRMSATKFPDGSVWDPSTIKDKLKGTKSPRGKKRPRY